jgi:hypothetical protein
MLYPTVGCKHQHLYWSESGRASQETAVSGCCQEALSGIVSRFGVCMWDGSQGGAVFGWPFLQSLLHTVSLTLSMGILVLTTFTVSLCELCGEKLLTGNRLSQHLPLFFLSSF